jgi:predicted DNA-binding transcriptional regulator
VVGFPVAQVAIWFPVTCAVEAGATITKSEAAFKSMQKVAKREKVNMLADYKIDPIVEGGLLSFLRDAGCSSVQFKLLCFWSRHPRAKLSLYTIARALDTARIDLRNAITALLEKGIIIAEHNSDNLTTYALSHDQRTQEYIEELAELDWRGTANLEKQLKEENVLSVNKKE